MKTKASFLLLISTATLALGACVTDTPYQKPDIAAPQNWQAQNLQAGEQVGAQWWQNFNSAELNAIIKTALAQNTDLAASLARIAQARANLKTSNASLLPDIDANAGSSINRTKPSTGKSTTNKALNLGADVTYTLDLFGRTAADIEAAKASLEQSKRDHIALALTCASDTARDYFTLVNLRERIAIARKNVAASQHILDIIQARYDAGTTTAYELNTQGASLSAARASLKSLEEQAQNATTALALMLGTTVQNVNIKADSLATLTAPTINAGLPADIVARRPDIAAVEQQLIAANANIKAARAAYYPSMSLSSGFTLSRSPIADPAATIFSLAASLTQPIFKGGALDAALEAATAQQTELLQTYRKTVLTAFTEVEDAITAINTATARKTLLDEATNKAQKAYDITLARFEVGTIDMQTLLDAQTTLLNAQDSAAGAHADALSASVLLYAALGGGWQS